MFDQPHNRMHGKRRQDQRRLQQPQGKVLLAVLWIISRSQPANNFTVTPCNTLPMPGRKASRYTQPTAMLHQAALHPTPKHTASVCTAHFNTSAAPNQHKGSVIHDLLPQRLPATRDQSVQMNLDNRSHTIIEQDSLSAASH